jgi:hypothetical protein
VLITAHAMAVGSMAKLCMPPKMQPLLPDKFEKQQGMYECGYGQPNNVAIAI